LWLDAATAFVDESNIDEKIATPPANKLLFRLSKQVVSGKADVEKPEKLT
jgi:hypothetical protein